MPTDRLRSIVPMFGGATSYVETLDRILAYVAAHNPTTDDLVGWHRGQFANVSSRDSILRRLRYLEDVGFLREAGDTWSLDAVGRTYRRDSDPDTLFRLMSARNVGLRSLLYHLSAGPMTIDQVSDQQLRTHPQLGWTPGETDMAKQRTNWLRSMGLVRRRDDEYELTADGRDVVTEAVTSWTVEAADGGTEPGVAAGLGDDGLRARTVDTTVQARVIDREFRATVLARYDERCPVSAVDHPALLDVAHVLPWSEYPDRRADLSNVLALSKTHHAAFDRGLFTLDRDYRLRVAPDFETDCESLRRTILEQAGERIPVEGVDPDYLATHNDALAWV
jgi:putative restriction endonuclease